METQSIPETPRAAQATIPSDYAGIRNTPVSIKLDLLRYLAAMAVCICHWHGQFYIPFQQFMHDHTAGAALDNIFNAGSQAVMVFFVLSGYFIAGNIRRMHRLHTWSWKSYLTQRLTRLWIVLLPALGLTAAWDGLGINLHLKPQLYQGKLPILLKHDVISRFNWHTAWGNLFFLQNIYVPTFGSNDPLWSLSWEFWYYMLFALAIVCLISLKNQKYFKSGIHAALLLAIMLMTGKYILALSGAWLMGAALAYTTPPRLPAWMRTAIYVIFPLVFFEVYPYLYMHLTKAHNTNLYLSDYMVGIFTSLLMICIIQNPGRNFKHPTWIRQGAQYSYTLYLTHFPIFILLNTIFCPHQRWRPTPIHWLYGIGVLAAVNLFAYLTAMQTEFKTEQARKWIMKFV